MLYWIDMYMYNAIHGTSSGEGGRVSGSNIGTTCITHILLDVAGGPY